MTIGDRKKKGKIPSRPPKVETFFMYRRPRFLEVLHAIREEMSREADYDVDLFAEMVRSGSAPAHGPERNVRGFKSRAPAPDKTEINRSQRGKKHAGK